MSKFGRGHIIGVSVALVLLVGAGAGIPAAVGRESASPTGAKSSGREPAGGAGSSSYTWRMLRITPTGMTYVDVPCPNGTIALNGVVVEDLGVDVSGSHPVWYDGPPQSWRFFTRQRWEGGNVRVAVLCGRGTVTWDISPDF